MASITIRSLDDGLKERLRARAALHGRSMEEEVREILRASLDEGPMRATRLGDAIRARFEPLGGIELEQRAGVVTLAPNQDEERP